MTAVWIDFETYNEHPISAGTYKYAETVEIDLLSYAIGDAPAVSLDMTVPGAFENLPEEFITAVADCDRIWAHYAQFDRKVWEHSKFNDVIPCPPIEKWCCTMTQAYEHGLPGKLAELCVVLGVPQELAKVKDGSRLVLLFCKPLGKNRKLRRATRETHPVDRVKYLAYGANDVEAMRSCHKRMPRVNYPNNASELALYHLDQKINDRGIYMDAELADAAILMITKEQLRLKEALIEHTDGTVTSANRRNKLLEFLLDEYGIAVDDLQKTTVQSMLADSDIPESMKELLLIRRDVSKASTAKYKRLASAICSDGRLRGMLQFRGASRTGRACLAEGTEVLTRVDGCISYLPIEVVTTDHEVFDGIDWVKHEGIVDNGERNVVEYGLLTATRDHIVFTDTDTSMSFGELIDKELMIWRPEITDYTA